MKRYMPRKRKTDKQFKKMLKRRRSCLRSQDKVKAREDRVRLANYLEWRAYKSYLEKLEREKKLRERSGIRFSPTLVPVDSSPTCDSTAIYQDCW